MGKEYRYRAVQRIRGSDNEWVKLTGATFKSEEAVKAFVQSFREENAYFGWGREYGYQRQHWTDWEDFQIGD